MNSNQLSEVMDKVRIFEPDATPETISLSITVDKDGKPHRLSCEHATVASGTNATLAALDPYTNCVCLANCGYSFVVDHLGDDLGSAISSLDIINESAFADTDSIRTKTLDFDDVLELAHEYVQFNDQLWDQLAPSMSAVPSQYETIVNDACKALYERVRSLHEETLNTDHVVTLVRDRCISSGLITEEDSLDETPVLVAVDPLWCLRPAITGSGIEADRSDAVYALAVSQAIGALESAKVLTLPNWVVTTIAAHRADWILSDRYTDLDEITLDTARRLWSGHHDDPYSNFDTCVAAARAL